MADLNDKERQEIVAYLDGELGEREASVLEARLNLDPTARKEAEALRKAWDLLDYLPTPEPSPSFTNRTLERLTAQRTAHPQLQPTARRWPWAGLGWAAAVLLAAGTGFGITSYLLDRRPAEGEGPRAQRDKQDPLAGMSADDVHREMARNLRILENKRLYESVEDIELLRALDAGDLFGEED